MLFSFTYILIQYNSPLKINIGPSSRICGLRTYYNSFEEKKEADFAFDHHHFENIFYLQQKIYYKKAKKLSEILSQLLFNLKRIKSSKHSALEP